MTVRLSWQYVDFRFYVELCVIRPAMFQSAFRAELIPFIIRSMDEGPHGKYPASLLLWRFGNMWRIIAWKCRQYEAGNSWKCKLGHVSAFVIRVFWLVFVVVCLAWRHMWSCKYRTMRRQLFLAVKIWSNCNRRAQAGYYLQSGWYKNIIRTGGTLRLFPSLRWWKPVYLCLL